jgi:NAD-dependent deacetylase
VSERKLPTSQETATGAEVGQRPGASRPEVAGWIRKAGCICVLTGAGISTESGIPDFRGPQGVWTKDPAAERRSTFAHYLSGSTARAEVWRSRLAHPAHRAEPNRAHLALAELERDGRLDTLVTQNIDGLHLKAGNSPERVVEIHGSLREVVCLSCGARSPMAQALEWVLRGETDPACRACGGILKSATISFGQPLVAKDVTRARDAAQRCDLFLALGTRLQVFPVAELPGLALQSGARLVIANAQPTAYDELADAVFRDPLGELVPGLVESALDPS